MRSLAACEQAGQWSVDAGGTVRARASAGRAPEEDQARHPGDPSGSSLNIVSDRFYEDAIGKTFSFCIGHERPGLDGQPVLSRLRWVGIGPYTQAAHRV